MRTVHGEDAKRHKTVNISFNNNTNLNFFLDYSIYTVWDGLSPKTISRYCPFKPKVMKDFLRIRNRVRPVICIILSLFDLKYCQSRRWLEYTDRVYNLVH